MLEIKKDESGKTLRVSDKRFSRSKPQLVDLNQDGHLDLVIGESCGGFFYYEGLKSEQGLTFAEKGTALLDETGFYVKVRGNSTPHFVDWDDDGDMDLLSGSMTGGVFFVENRGSAKEPKWGKMETWVEDLSRVDFKQIPNTGKPSQSWQETNVHVVDLNGDGKKDLVIGDYNKHITGKDNQGNEISKKGIGFVWVCYNES